MLGRTPAMLGASTSLSSRVAATALAVATCGCWSSTTPFTAAEGRTDQMGFGLTRHEYTMFLLIAGTHTTVVGVGQAAVVDPLDSLWEVEDGGKRLVHCFFDGQSRSDCRAATFEAGQGGAFLDPLIVVDPNNLGSIAVRTDTRNVTGQQWIGAGGFVVHGSGTMRPTSARGIWVRSVAAGLRHCQLEGKSPRCAAVPVPASPLLRALGVFTLGETDVLWIQTGALFGSTGVSRCTAGPKQAPTCAAAQML